jgi:aspartate aminotransferase-like enzyme
MTARKLPPFGKFFLPGPTDVRPEVLEAMVHPMFAHRGPEMVAMLKRMEPRLKALFRTTRPVLMATSSATGFMEAAVKSGVRERLLVVDGGFFGDRFVQIARRCGKQVTRLPIELGHGLEPDRLSDAIREARADAVAMVHCETSTGTLLPLEVLAPAVKAHRDVTLLVDAVTSVGGSPVETDAWGLDFVFTGTQKALAVPPGLALAVASELMMERSREQAEPGWYFDPVLHEEAIDIHQPTQTPALPLYCALEVQLEYIEQEGGMEARWKRHHRMLEMMEAWVDAHPTWRFYAPPGLRAWTVSALQPPEGTSGREVVAGLTRQGYTIGTGLDDMADKMIRIGHMGDLGPKEFEGLLGVMGAI